MAMRQTALAMGRRCPRRLAIGKESTEPDPEDRRKACEQDGVHPPVASLIIVEPPGGESKMGREHALANTASSP